MRLNTPVGAPPPHERCADRLDASATESLGARRSPRRVKHQSKQKVSSPETGQNRAVEVGYGALYDIKAAASPPRAGCGRLASLAVLAGANHEDQRQELVETTPTAGIDG
jgi:hypothetical protein